jgi:hypothetical protein
MRIKSWMLLPLTILASAALLSADVVVDSFNTTDAESYLFWGDTDAGWYYTPSTSYTLDQFETQFDAAATLSAGYGDRTVTVGIYTDRPANGGTLLGSATFNSADAEGSFAGPTFSSGIPLVGGTTYFVGLQNIYGLGLNQVDYTQNGGDGPTGSVSPGTEWQDTNSLAQFGTEGCSDTNDFFCKPEMEFLKANPTSPVPEPANVSYLVFGLLAVGGWIQTRRNITKRLA